jgi:hypothetical protein
LPIDCGVDGKREESVEKRRTFLSAASKVGCPYNLKISDRGTDLIGQFFFSAVLSLSVG